MDRVCLDAARWHPLPRRAVAAQYDYLTSRARNAGWDNDPGMTAQESARTRFARLIGVHPEDIAIIPSTGWAEQMVVRALNLPDAGAILTDTAHFDASVLHYDMLARDGADVRYVTPGRDGIDLDDVKSALADGKVRLIATSLVSNTTGFVVDIRELVALAHSYDALVFVDIIQAAGAIPLDMAGIGADFCACAGYKWLMGDMGLGFLYVNPAILPSLRRPIHGFRQMREFIEPWPPAGPRDWILRSDAEGFFGVNSRAAGVAASIAASLELLEELDIAAIHAHRAAQLQQIRAGLTPLGYVPITPVESVAPFLIFNSTYRPDTAACLRSANIDAGISLNRLRIAPSLNVKAADIAILIDSLDI